MMQQLFIGLLTTGGSFVAFVGGALYLDHKLALARERKRAAR